MSYRDLAQTDRFVEAKSTYGGYEVACMSKVTLIVH